jgi:hypothetical protein
MIAKAEAEGKQVRPTRNTQFVESYRALFTDGSFKTYEYFNYGKGPPQATALTYAELEQLFASISPLAKWKHDSDLTLGDTHFSVRAIAADDPGDAGKRGGIEVGWLEDGRLCISTIADAALTAERANGKSGRSLIPPARLQSCRSRD